MWWLWILNFLKKILLLPLLLQLWNMFKIEPIIGAGLFLVVYILRQVFGLKGKDSTIGVTLVLGIFAAWAYYRHGLSFAVMKLGFSWAFWAMGFYQIWKFLKYAWENWLRRK